MSTAQLRVEEHAWPGHLQAEAGWVATDNRRRQLLPSLIGLCLIVADVALVAGAFLLAYCARFSVDESLPTLALDRYIRLAALEGLLACVLLATHGLYDLERPRSWPVRLRSIISSSSTALVLAVTVSYFLGDQAFSRLWLTSGWVV